MVLKLNGFKLVASTGRMGWNSMTSLHQSSLSTCSLYKRMLTQVQYIYSISKLEIEKPSIRHKLSEKCTYLLDCFKEGEVARLLGR